MMQGEFSSATLGLSVQTFKTGLNKKNRQRAYIQADLRRMHTASQPAKLAALQNNAPGQDKTTQHKVIVVKTNQKYPALHIRMCTLNYADVSALLISAEISKHRPQGRCAAKRRSQPKPRFSADDPALKSLLFKAYISIGAFNEIIYIIHCGYGKNFRSVLELKFKGFFQSEDHIHNVQAVQIQIIADVRVRRKQRYILLKFYAQGLVHRADDVVAIHGYPFFMQSQQ
jgi:hypothetical protein